MESDEDPLRVKFVVSSLEFERFKYYEKKCQELSEELEKLKLKNSEQVGGGKYVVEPYIHDPLTTPALNEVTDTEKPTLINYGVPIVKDDDNDDYDESALLHLIPESHQFNANFLLKKIDSRASELTWNSSGVVFIDKYSIPDSNIFMIYPHLFKNSLPNKKIPGLIEVIKKLDVMGLSQYISLKLPKNNLTNKADFAESFGAGEKDFIVPAKDDIVQKDLLSVPQRHKNGELVKKKPTIEDNSTLSSSVIDSWWYIG